MTPEMEQLYDAAVAADNAWSEALQRQFGTRAGDARYDKRGVSTLHLKDLHDRFRTANDAWREAVRLQQNTASSV